MRTHYNGEGYVLTRNIPLKLLSGGFGGKNGSSSYFDSAALHWSSRFFPHITAFSIIPCILLSPTPTPLGLGAVANLFYFLCIPAHSTHTWEVLGAHPQKQADLFCSCHPSHVTYETSASANRQLSQPLDLSLEISEFLYINLITGPCVMLNSQTIKFMLWIKLLL